jgi:hypothetical protein
MTKDMFRAAAATAALVALSFPLSLWGLHLLNFVFSKIPG